MSRDGLREAVEGLRYQPGWRFKLHAWGIPRFTEAVVEMEHAIWAGEPWYLLIELDTIDSDDPGRLNRVKVTHNFPVPPYPPGSWRRWVLECIFLVHRHEAMEHARWGGERPFYPDHAPGANPYQVTEKP